MDPSTKEKILRKLNDLPLVLDEDGFKASPVTAEMKEAVVSFLDKVPKFYQQMLDPETGITLAPHGSIVLDWYFRRSFVSANVSPDSFIFFAELPDGSTIEGSQDHPRLHKALAAVYLRPE